MYARNARYGRDACQAVFLFPSADTVVYAAHTTVKNPRYRNRLTISLLLLLYFSRSPPGGFRFVISGPFGFPADRAARVVAYKIPFEMFGAKVGEFPFRRTPKRTFYFYSVRRRTVRVNGDETFRPTTDRTATGTTTFVRDFVAAFAIAHALKIRLARFVYNSRFIVLLGHPSPGPRLRVLLRRARRLPELRKLRNTATAVVAVVKSSVARVVPSQYE